MANEIRQRLETEITHVMGGAVGNLVSSVSVYGSLVRGDFWIQQSDVDLLVEVAVAPFEEMDRASAIAAFERIEPAFGNLATDVGVKKVEACVVDETSLRQQRHMEFRNRWIQFGFHGFDTLAHHRTIVGHDPIARFTVAETEEELVPLARDRILGIVRHELVEFPKETWKWACEAAKAAQLAFSLPEGVPPTRHKEESLQNFLDYVPAFDGKNFAGELWDNYRAGRESEDEDYLIRCREFVLQIASLMDA